jgi:hypothetical protein
MKEKSVIIELSNDLTKFRSTSIKSYYEMKSTNDQSLINENVANNFEFESSARLSAFSEANFNQSINVALSKSIKRGRERLRKYLIQINQSNVSFLIDEDDQFTVFRQKKISRLMKKKIFRLVDSQEISTNARIFNSRFVDEIKNADTKKAFEKSRLIVQAYNDLNKNLMLTQSLTIQRVSQRLIVCLAIILQNQNQSINLYLKNVTQIYVQSTFELNRDFYIRSSLELITLLNVSSDCILKRMKSLYDVLETENH